MSKADILVSGATGRTGGAAIDGCEDGKAGPGLCARRMTSGRLPTETRC